MPSFGPKVTDDLRRIVAEVIAPWSSSEVWTPAAGDLALARVAKKRGGWDVHTSDPTLLPAATGSYLAGLPFRVALQPEAQAVLGYVSPYLTDDPATALAAVMLIAKIAPNLGKTNHFYRRQLGGYQSQWESLLSSTLAKVHAEPLRLESHFIGGVLETLHLIPQDAAVITHGGLWKFDRKLAEQLAAVFDWDAGEIPADVTKKQTRAEALELLMLRPEWLLLLNQEDEDLAPFLRARVQSSNRGMPTFVYASQPGQQRLVTPHQKIETIKAPVLTPGQKLAGDLGLTVVRATQFDSLRAHYLNANIRPGAAPFSVVVTVGGVIIGAYALDFDPQLSAVGADSGKVPQPAVYLLSDFAVGPSDYPRLSKLVVLAATSHEAKLLAERKDGNRRRGIVTTAFAQNPVSMKYRGILDLVTRSEVEGEDFKGGKGWKLNYGGALGRWSLAEAMTIWREKHQK